MRSHSPWLPVLRTVLHAGTYVRTHTQVAPFFTNLRERPPLAIRTCS